VSRKAACTRAPPPAGTLKITGRNAPPTSTPPRQVPGSTPRWAAAGAPESNRSAAKALERESARVVIVGDG
jgi:hypothetical protein